MTDKRTPDSDGKDDTKRLRSRTIQALNTARVAILLAAILVAYANGDLARAGNPAPELQMASLSLGVGESSTHITLPDVTVVSPSTYSEPSLNGDGPRVIGPCSRAGNGRIVCPDLIPALHYNR